MNKHKTLAYIKYGKLISEINDKIINQTVRSDMIKFLIKFPGNLIYPNIYQLNYVDDLGADSIDTVESEIFGRFKFKITKSSKIIFIFIDFDGKNNFHIWSYNEWEYNLIKWASIDDIEYCVEHYQINFNNIIEKND